MMINGNSYGLHMKTDPIEKNRETTTIREGRLLSDLDKGSDIIRPPYDRQKIKPFSRGNQEPKIKEDDKLILVRNMFDKVMENIRNIVYKTDYSLFSKKQYTKEELLKDKQISFFSTKHYREVKESKTGDCDDLALAFANELRTSNVGLKYVEGGLREGQREKYSKHAWLETGDYIIETSDPADVRYIKKGSLEAEKYLKAAEMSTDLALAKLDEAAKYRPEWLRKVIVFFMV